MRIQTLKGVIVNDIQEVFNSSFSDYFIPFQLTLEQLRSKMEDDKNNLDLSVGVFDKNKLIAFILHGLDTIDGKNVVYNGGTGVIPSKRGNGLTKRMYDFILPTIRDTKVDHLILEVVSKNIQAIKSYKAVGFATSRELKCYKGQISPLVGSNNVDIKGINTFDWELMQSFWDIQPTWQNSIKELEGSNRLIGAYIEKQLIGYLVFNPKIKRILQIAISRDFRRRKVASTLINFLVKDHDNRMSIINVDKTSISTNSFFRAIGLENYLDQEEMKLILG